MASKSDLKERKGFFYSDFNTALFTEIVRNISPIAKLIDFKDIGFSSDTGIITGLTKSHTNETAITGLKSFRIRYHEEGDSKFPDKCKEMDIVFKIKPKGDETMKAFATMMESRGHSKLAKLHLQRRFDMFYGSESRELTCLNVDQPAWKAIQPRTLYTHMDTTRDIYMFAMENLQTGQFSHRDTVNRVEEWTETDIQDAFRGIAKFHALYYGNTEQVPIEVSRHIEPFFSARNAFLDPIMMQYMRVRNAINIANNPKFYDPNIARIIHHALDNMDDICAILDSAPLTLIHNDFNLRNICLRKNPSRDQNRLCLYDWEEVRIANPQRDICEFISFVLPAGSGVDVWEIYLEQYRQCLMEELQLLRDNGTEETKETKETNAMLMESVQKDSKQFVAVFHMSIIEMVLNNLAGYIYIHGSQPLDFLPRVVDNTFRYVKAFAEKYAFLSACQ